MPPPEPEGRAGRLLGGRPDRVESLGAYLTATGGYVDADPGEVLARVGAARLRGRGGAAFPTAVKLQAVRDSEDPIRVVVANGEEGEPASLKDRFLCRMRPHLVLDGLAHCAAVVDAEQAVLYVSDQLAAERLGAALGERPPDRPTSVFQVDPSYVAGEESAVVRALDGGPAKPTAKPPRPFEAGLGGHPTLVQNVETLANVALLASQGVDSHLAHGSEGSTGTFLLTLSGGDRPPRLCELDFGVRLGRLVDLQLAPGTTATGVLMGGFFGGVLGPEALDLPLTHEAFAAAQSGLGCAAVVVLSPADCPIAVAADVLAFFAVANAGQCGSCIRGTAAMRDALDRLAGGAAAEADLENLARWAGSLPGRGACGTLDAAAATAASLLREFPAAVERHLRLACPICARRAGAALPPRFAIEAGKPVATTVITPMSDAGRAADTGGGARASGSHIFIFEL